MDLGLIKHIESVVRFMEQTNTTLDKHQKELSKHSVTLTLNAPVLSTVSEISRVA